MGSCLEGKGWGSIFLGNHDFARMVSRFGNDDLHRDSSAKLLATLLMTHGTPYVYQGDELGMVNNQVTHIEEFDDVEIRSTYQDWKIKGKILINLSPFQMKKVEINEHPCNGMPLPMAALAPLNHGSHLTKNTNLSMLPFKKKTQPLFSIITVN